MIKNRIFILPVFILIGFIFISCEQKEDEAIESFEIVNTLDNSSVGNGLTGHIQDYFYSLEDEIEVQFYLFNSATFGFKYEDYLALFNKEPTQLTFKTYPQLVVSDTPDDFESSGYMKIDSNSPQWVVESSILDSLNYPESLLSSGLDIIYTDKSEYEVLLWDASKKYYTNNAVFHNGSYWIALTTPEGEPTNINTTWCEFEIEEGCDDRCKSGGTFVVISDSSGYCDKDENGEWYQGVVMVDSVALFSVQFKNVDKLVWEFDAEPDLQRYKPVNSDWLFKSDTIKYYDTLDVVSYTSVVEELPVDGFLFVDKSEWESTKIEYSEVQVTIDTTFEFESWRRLGGDSLMFRKNTDCNDDGAWTSEEVFVDCNPDTTICEGDVDWADSLGNGKWNDGEDFTDIGNGVWDPAEVFIESDNPGDEDYGTQNDWEPFEDRNCNELWDDAEPKNIGIDSCEVDLGGVWYDSESFCDLGNGIFDAAEEFTDNDENGVGDMQELFIFDIAPKTLLVNWEDPLNPVPMTTIYPNDSLTTRWGIKYYDIIRETDRSDSKFVKVDNVDSLVTQYNNKIIETVGEEGHGTDYYITKTEWIESTPAGDFRNYDYHIFKLDEENIYKLVHPSYFKPYGYHGFTYDRLSQAVSFSTPGYDDGFWYTPNSMDEVLYYTSSGLFRDGEIVNEEYYDTTSVGIYFVRKSQQVFSDSVTVPAKNIRGSINSDGTVQCYTEPPGSVTSIDECPAADTTFNNCFKIIRGVNMTMIGSGVEWEEENTTWLVKNYGIVKTELKVRWGESIWFDSDDEIWAGYSRWEMGQYSSESGDRGLLSKMLNPVRSVSLNSLDDVNELNNDPYQIHRTLGLHRIQFPVEH